MRGAIAISEPVTEDISEDGWVIDFFVNVKPSQVINIDEDIFYAPKITCHYYSWTKIEFITEFDQKCWQEIIELRKIEGDVFSYTLPKNPIVRSYDFEGVDE
jgi:hypothetical protein